MAGNDLSSQLMTLADRQRERLNVYPKSTSDPASCYIDHSISSYLHCNGSWEKISSKVYERFYLLPGDGRHLDIQVRSNILLVYVSWTSLFQIYVTDSILNVLRLMAPIITFSYLTLFAV